MPQTGIFTGQRRDIYKKVFVMYYLNSERRCLVQRAAGTEAHVMRRSSAQWRSFEEAGIGEVEGRRIFRGGTYLPQGCGRDRRYVEFYQYAAESERGCSGVSGTDLDKLAERVCVLPQIRAIEEMVNGCRHRQVCSIW